jgi:hypothetical protein
MNIYRSLRAIALSSLAQSRERSPRPPGHDLRECEWKYSEK